MVYFMTHDYMRIQIKKNMRKKKTDAKNAALAQVWSSDSFILQTIARNSF